MTLIQFFKITLFKIIFLVITILSLVFFYNYSEQQIEALRGISFEEYFGSAYYQCCQNKDLSEHNMSYCQSENLDTDSGCEELNQKLNQINIKKKEHENRQKMIKTILLGVLLFISYLFACIIDLSYHKIMSRLGH